MHPSVRTLVLLVVVLTLGCASSAPRTTATRASPGPDIAIFVREANSSPLVGLSGVEVLGVLANGERVSLGRTADGKLSLSKQRCRDLGVAVILLCREGYHCGAIPVFNPESRFYDYNEWNIDLVGVTLY